MWGHFGTAKWMESRSSNTLRITITILSRVTSRKADSTAWVHCNTRTETGTQVNSRTTGSKALELLLGQMGENLKEVSLMGLRRAGEP